MPPLPPPRDASSGDWNTESCQTLETQAAHTRCQCQHLSTFAVLAQPPKDLVSGREAWAAQGIRVTPNAILYRCACTCTWEGRLLLFTVMTPARECVAVSESERACTCVHLVVSGRVWVNGYEFICARVPLCT